MCFKTKRDFQHMFLYAKHIIIIDCFYIALFSALDQTHCARL